MSEALLFDREIVSTQKQDDGTWSVRYSCGHEAVFIVRPFMPAYSCAQCVNEYLEKIKSEKPA